MYRILSIDIEVELMNSLVIEISCDVVNQLEQQRGRHVTLGPQHRTLGSPCSRE